MQEIGLLRKHVAKDAHTIVSKLQQKGFLVLKRYKDAKNIYFLQTRVKDVYL